MNLTKKKVRVSRPELNGRTPKWFRDWHLYQYVPDQERQNETIGRNTKFITIIVTALIGASVLGSNLEEVGKFISSLAGNG